MNRERIYFFQTMLCLILMAAFSLSPLSAETRKDHFFFDLDIGADLFNQPVPQFNILEKDYSSIQTTKNIEIVKKQLHEKLDDSMIAYETIARFVRAESYGFSDMKRALQSLETLDAELNRSGAEAKSGAEKKSKSIKDAYSLYHLLINVSKIVINKDYSEKNRKYLTNEITRILEQKKNAWNLILRLLIESAVPGTGDHKLTAQRLLNIKSGNPQNHFAQANAFLISGNLCNCEKTRMLAPRSFEISLILTANDERLLERIVNILIAILEDNETNNVPTPLWLTEYSYKKLIQQDPENPVSRNNLGYFYATYNIKLDEAYKHCMKAVEIDPENPYFLDSLGWVCFRMEKLDKAETYLVKARDINPEIAEIRAHLANVYYSLENYSKAVEELKVLLELEPDNIVARNNLGYILTDKGIDFNLAYKHLKYAIEKAPEDPSYNDSLGWLYYKSGNLILARKFIEKALKLRPDMPEVLFHLSKLELSEGNIKKSLETALEILKNEPDLDGLVDYIGFVTALKTIYHEIDSISSLKAQSAQSIRKRFDHTSFIAELYYENGFYDQALKIYRELLKTTPDKRIFLERINSINKLKPTPLSIKKKVEIKTVRFPSILNDVPETAIQASIIKKDLIERFFKFSVNNINYLKIFNPGLLSEIIPQEIVQSIFKYNDRAVFLLSANYADKTENLRENIEGITNIISLFSKGRRIKKIKAMDKKNKTLDLWEINIGIYRLYMTIAKNRLIITSSKDFCLKHGDDKNFGFKSITSKKGFSKLWANSECSVFHAVFYSNKVFYEALFEKIPALKKLRNFTNLLKMSETIEKIHFPDANTLEEYYSIKCETPDCAVQLGDFINDLMGMSKILYQSDKISITPVISTDEEYLKANISVKGFLGMKDFINKHFIKNKNFIINYLKSVSSEK